MAAMSALKSYVIVRPLTYSAVVTDRFKNIIVTVIWTGNCGMVVGADLLGVRWVLDPSLRVSVPTGNPTAGRGLRIFEAFIVSGASGSDVLISFALILNVVRKHHLAIAFQAAATSVEGRLEIHPVWTASIRSARSLLFIVASFDVAYFPGTASFQPGLVLPVWYQTITASLLTVYNVVNGLLYVLLYKTTRRDLAKMFFGNCFIGNTLSPLALNSSRQPAN